MSNSNLVSTASGTRKMIKLTLLGLLGCVLNLTPLHASVVFTFAEEGSDVVATTSGSIDAGWGTVFFTQNLTLDRGLLAFDSIRAERNGAKRYYGNGWTKNNNLSDVPLDTSGVVTGDAFGYAGSQGLIVPAAVSVGDAFTPNTTITWANETFTTLGLDTSLSTTPLTLFTLDNGSTISAVRTSGEPAAVPEPSSLALLGCVAVVASGVRRWRAKKKV